MISYVAKVIDRALDAPTNEAVELKLPALKEPLSKLAPWKSKKDFAFNVIGDAEAGKVFFMRHDPMLNNVVCLSVDSAVSADCFASVDFATFQQATINESRITITFDSVVVRTKKTRATLMHVEVLPSVERRLSSILCVASEKQSVLPAELWPYLRAATKKLLLEAYMESRASLLDMYIQQYSEGTVSVSVSDDHHCCVSFIQTETTLEMPVVFPQKSLQSIGAVFSGEVEDISIFTDATGVFFSSTDAFIYIPQAKENASLYKEPAELAYNLRTDEVVARALVDSKDFRAGVDFVHAMVKEQRASCVVGIDKGLHLSRSSTTVGSGSYAVETLKSQGSAKVQMDVRLLQEVCDVLRNVPDAIVSIHSENFQQCVSVSFSDTVSRTWYIAGSQQVEDN